MEESFLSEIVCRPSGLTYLNICRDTTGHHPVLGRTPQLCQEICKEKAGQRQDRGRPEAGQGHDKQLRTHCSAGKRGARSVK